MNTFYIEDQFSSTVMDREPIQGNDSDEAESSPASSFDPFNIFREHGMIRLQEGDLEHDNVVRDVQTSLRRAYGVGVSVLGVHTKGFSGLTARLIRTFQINVDAVAKKCSGDANVKDAWYGGSKYEICRMVSNGFICKNDGMQGIQLSPVQYPFQSIMSAEEDENGMKHILLCRVILGNMKIVQPGTQHFDPCSNESFDSGVDSLVEPTRYIIWNAYMNSHIFPSAIISFKFPAGNSIQYVPKSPFMRIIALMNVLSNYLRPSQMADIGRYHKSFLEKKISRDQMVKHIRLIAGDELLRTVIRSVNLATSGNLSTTERCQQRGKLT
ncbi:hypothetical protein Leryth_016201 [Lithospermum erythrorhizon]|nr:hypothetical protein Leryth_016201 [Lithospermum erythrorhizon]